MTHDELRKLVPIYALDALEGDEELEVRLSNCLLLLLEAEMKAEPIHRLSKRKG